jgi:hypothetical protein
MSNVSSAEKRAGSVLSTRPAPTSFPLTNSFTSPPLPKPPPSQVNSIRIVHGPTGSGVAPVTL